MGMTRGWVVPPPARQPVAVLDVPTVVGEALVLWHPDFGGQSPHAYGWRGWADVYDVDGDPFIEVVPEAVWHRHDLLGTPPEKVTRWPARAAWIA